VGWWSGHLDGLMLIREGLRNWIWKCRLVHKLVTMAYDHIFSFAKVRRLSGRQRVDVEIMPFKQDFKLEPALNFFMGACSKFD
jgi:hypothetical protein